MQIKVEGENSIFPFLYLPQVYNLEASSGLSHPHWENVLSLTFRFFDLRQPRTSEKAMKIIVSMNNKEYFEKKKEHPKVCQL